MSAQPRNWVGQRHVVLCLLAIGFPGKHRYFLYKNTLLMSSLCSHVFFFATKTLEECTPLEVEPSQQRVAVDYFMKRWRTPVRVVKQAQWMSVTVAGVPLSESIPESPIVHVSPHSLDGHNPARSGCSLPQQHWRTSLAPQKPRRGNLKSVNLHMLKLSLLLPHFLWQ